MRPPEDGIARATGEGREPETPKTGPSKNLSPVVEGRELCPVCGRALEPNRCKLACACGYFMSCSDF